MSRSALTIDPMEDKRELTHSRRPGRGPTGRLSEPGSHLLFQRPGMHFWAFFVRWEHPPNAQSKAGVLRAYCRRYRVELLVDIESGIVFEGLKKNVYYLHPADRQVLYEEAVLGGRKVSPKDVDVVRPQRAKRKPGLLHMGRNDVVTKIDQERVKARMYPRKEKEREPEIITTPRLRPDASGGLKETCHSRRVRLSRGSGKVDRPGKGPR